MSDDFMDLLSGGGAGEQGQDEKGMEDLLGGLMGGGGGAGGLGSLLGGLMGGGAQSGEAGDAGDMAGMLGSLLGGGGGSGGAGGLGGLLGGLFGGGGGGGEQMSFGGGGGASLPFASTLAEKLGISEQMANMLIMGAIGLLTSSMAKNRGGGEVDINSLTDPDFIRSSGVSGRVAGQMGISEDEAVLGLQQAMGMLAPGGQPAPQPKKATAKKTTAKKSKATTAQPAATKKSSTKATKSTPKKKSTKKESSSDFMDLLDDPNG